MTKHIVVEIDDVIADTTSRQSLLNESFDAYHAACASDKPRVDTVEVLRALSSHGHEILAVTGRPARFDKPTLEWLNRYSVPVDEVLMRPDTDYRSEVDVKAALLENYFGSLDAARERVLVGFESKDRTIEGLRDLGFTIWGLR
jgi:hypothetical protein